MGDWEELLASGPPAVQLHRRRLGEDDAPATMPFGKTELLFTPKKSPPAPFNPDLNGDGRSDISHDPIRKEGKPQETEAPDTSGDSGSDDNGGNSFTDTPTASEVDIPSPNQPSATTTDEALLSPTETSTSSPELNEYSTTRSRYEMTTTSSDPQGTTTTHPAEAHESATSTSWTRVTAATDSPTTLCSTSTHCSTNSVYPFTTCYNHHETTMPYALQKNIANDTQGIENIFKDTGKLIAVILLTMIVSVLMTAGCIWGYKRRAKKRKGIQGGESIGGDVEGGAGMKRILWGVLGKRKEQGTTGKANVVGVSNAPAAGQAEASVSPEMAQRNHQTLSIILPPGSGHRHRSSNNTILDRTLSTASSLTVPPYPGSSAASGTTRSSSTRTARSVASNITDDTVVRTKREYRDAVGRLAEENMHSDHISVADGFHLAPPNPFEDDGPPVAGAGGMGGSGVGVGGLGEVDGEGNRVVVRPPPPIIRVGDAMNPFEDPDMDLDMGVADGFSPNGTGGMMRGGGSPPPQRLENPFEDAFEDGLGGYPEVDVGIGDGFSGYVPGQMGGMGGRNAERRVSMRGGDARRRVSGDGASINSSMSGESLSSNETLRGDLEDWRGSGGGGLGSHIGHGSGGRL